MLSADFTHLLAVGEAARRLQVSPKMVLYLVRQGKLPAVRTPYGHLLDPTDVERLARERAERRRRTVREG